VRSLVVALSVCALSAAGAVASYRKAFQLRTEASWLMIRGDAQGAEYAATLDSAIVQMLLILAAVVAAICSYVLHLLHRLNRQLADAEPVEGDPKHGAAA
jgi:hypothetical protein